jgi:hypothetical protein
VRFPIRRPRDLASARHPRRRSNATAISDLSSDRKRMICEFEVADAERVRQSQRSAGVKFDQVWTADVYSRDVPTASD